MSSAKWHPFCLGLNVLSVDVCVMHIGWPRDLEEVIPKVDDTYICHACPVPNHYGDVIMGTMASQIPSLTIVYTTAYWGADQRKHQSSASLAFVSPGTGEFPAQMASNAENVSIWWRHHVITWTSDHLLPVEPLVTNFNEQSEKKIVLTFSVK